MTATRPNTRSAARERAAADIESIREQGASRTTILFNRLADYDTRIGALQELVEQNDRVSFEMN